MNELMNQLKKQGLDAKLTNTGGGVMVAFIQANGKTIGVDTSSVCIYDGDMYQDELVFELDESLGYSNALETLAFVARLTFEGLHGSWVKAGN